MRHCLRGTALVGILDTRWWLRHTDWGAGYLERSLLGQGPVHLPELRRVDAGMLTSERVG